MAIPTSDENREQAAVSAYIDLLRSQNGSMAEQSKCKHFLRYLATELHKKPVTSDNYRKAADYTLRNFPEDEFFMRVVREFFYYWSGTAKPEESRVEAKLSPNATKLGTTLPDLMHKATEDPWFKSDLKQLERQFSQLRSLHRYVDELKRNGVDMVSIEARERIVKVLLLVLRDTEYSGAAYRQAVDSVMMLFSRTEKWHVFVALAREFFYFWINDPEAANHLQLKVSAVDIRELMN